MKAYSLLFGSLLLLGTVAGCNSSSNSQQQSAEKAPAQTAEAPAAAKAASDEKIILFFGNSLTAGYGLEPSQAFPALIEQKAEAAGINCRAVNAGLSGETTAGGKSRISWVLRQPVDIFVLELGGNDGLRGLPVEATRNNLQAIIDTVRKKSPDARIVLAGMQIPPNMGPDYTAKFRQIYPELAKKNQLELIPFLLEGVGGIPKLNLPDGIHPTAEGHKIVANTVWKTLGPLLTGPQ